MNLYFILIFGTKKMSVKQPISVKLGRVSPFGGLLPCRHKSMVSPHRRQNNQRTRDLLVVQSFNLFGGTSTQR